MNDRDSELVRGQFLNHGYQLADNYEDADVILLNTCSVRQHAEEKVWSELGRLRKLRIPNGKFQIPNKSQISNSKTKNKLLTTDNKLPIIGVIGCMATNLGNIIIERMPYVDLVVGPNDLGRISELVELVKREKCREVRVSSDERSRSFYKNLYHQDKKHCYVNISEGCSNFCSYCVVPYVRGKHRSRPLEDILKEIEQLVKDGVSSITLLGQNVNDYESSEYRVESRENKKVEFVELVELISNIDGVKELSFVTSHPKDIDFRSFDLMKKKKNIKKYLHLPVQSGSNRILKLMHRKYTREKYFEIINQYREVIPEGILATDIIVGFPTETEKDFKDTLDLMKKIRFDFAYIFKYSPRPHTKAAELADDVSLETKKQRHKILLELQREISQKLKTQN